MNRKNKTKRIFIIALVLLSITFILSMTIGKYTITLKDVFNIFFGQEVDFTVRNVFLKLRLPRIVMAVLSGFALSVSGSIYQIIFKNPLAAPDLIGVSSGANAGAAIALVCFNVGIIASIFSSFIGGILAVMAVVFLVALLRQDKSSTYILVGIAIKAISDSIIMTMKYFADPEKQLATIDYWTMGSFSNITLDKLQWILPIFLIGLIGIIIFRWQINLLVLEDDDAKMLGVRVGVTRFFVLFNSTLLVASTVCVTGVISFIGLISPHIARIILKKSDFSACVLSGIIGAIILLISDCLARTLGSSEIPISILTSIIGVPFLIYLLYKQGN